jgi:hypothetical protein
MSLPINVRAYSRYKANERPASFCVDEGLIDIAAVEDRWYDPGAEYFRVRSTEGKRYILRCAHDGKWTLQSGFDGVELLARRSIKIVTVDPSVIRQAELRIAGCERCRGDEADHLFDSIIADVLGKDGAFEFILSQPAHCPNCRAKVSRHEALDVAKKLAESRR